MIRFINVSKYFVTPVGRHYVFRDVNIELPLDKNVGVIGPNGSGKSTFLRLLAGADYPSSGVIKKSGSISPPMGLTPVLQRSLSALENVRFAGRIYGMKKPEIERMVAYVRELAGIGAYFEMPVETYSAGMRQKVAFGINMSMHFDYYLFDEISAGGDREFRKMARVKVAERLRTSRFLMTSHDTRELLELCDAGIVIKDGKLNYFEDIRDAALFYGDDIETDGNTAPRRGRFRRLSESTVAEGAEQEADDEGRKRRRRKRDGHLRAAKRNAALPSAETSSQLVLGDVSPTAAGSPPLPWQTPVTPYPVEEKKALARAEVHNPAPPVSGTQPSEARVDELPQRVSRGT